MSAYLTGPWDYVHSSRMGCNSRSPRLACAGRPLDLVMRLDGALSMAHPAVYEKLREVARNGETISYGGVARLAGIDMDNPHFATLVGHMLDDINRSEHRAGHPLLSAVVIGLDGASLRAPGISGASGAATRTSSGWGSCIECMPTGQTGSRRETER